MSSIDFEIDSLIAEIDAELLAAQREKAARDRHTRAENVRLGILRGPPAKPTHERRYLPDRDDNDSSSEVL